MISPTTTITEPALLAINHNDAKEAIAAVPDRTKLPQPHNVSSPTDFLTKFTVTLPPAITALTILDVETRLDAIYQPGIYDVVCGRGKGSYNRPGNVHFRALVASYIAKYQAARTKLDKSTVLGCIVERVQALTDPTTGQRARFVKKSGANWVQIGHELAREKVGHALREAAAAAGQSIPTLRRSAETVVAKTNKLSHSKTMAAMQTLAPMVSPAPLPLTAAAATLVRNGSTGAFHRPCLPFARGIGTGAQPMTAFTHLDAFEAFEALMRMST
jgi:hypothetical protein